MVILYSNMHPACADADNSLSDKFKFAAGGYTLVRSDTIASAESNTGAGITINTKETFDIKTEKTVSRLDGYYRFNKQDALNNS